MAQSLIEFQLRPLTEIRPWGAPQDPNLSWFGLSGGMWWINAADQRLFEYSSHALKKFGGPRYCDYQVVRLHEDFIDLLPDAVEEVPAEFVPCVALEKEESWNAKWERWMAALPDEHISDADFDLIDSASSWRGRRRLDSGYLAPSFDLRIWSARGLVHLEWDNRAKLVEEVRAWTAGVGSFAMPAAEFISELQDFDDRFMRAMALRVEDVCAGALEGRGIRVDLEALAREQIERSHWLQERLHAGASRTDWGAVGASMLALEERAR